MSTAATTINANPAQWFHLSGPIICDEVDLPVHPMGWGWPVYYQWPPLGSLKLSAVKGYGNMELEAAASPEGVAIVPLQMGFIQDQPVRATGPRAQR